MNTKKEAIEALATNIENIKSLKDTEKIMVMIFQYIPKEGKFMVDNHIKD